MDYFIANWKMNMAVTNIGTWLSVWKKLTTAHPIPHKSKVIIAPSYIHLPLLINIEAVNLAAQNVSEFEAGAYTGEVGLFQIRDFCKYAIVGHSELGEPHALVMRKAKKCIENNIIPIICFVNAHKVKDFYIENALLAWEDPENISKDGVYNPKPAADIENTVTKMKADLPQNTKIIYGGSVNTSDIQSLKKIENLDGVLVGSASLDADHFYTICTIY